MAMSQNWVMLISEQHRYQGVSYKSDIIVVSGTTLLAPDLISLGLPSVRNFGESN